MSSIILFYIGGDGRYDGFWAVLRISKRGGGPPPLRNTLSKA
jgi:hypothetical protein